MLAIDDFTVPSNNRLKLTAGGDLAEH